MTKTKSTKRALLLSALSLLLCVSMLVGSTFAWFTDSVTSTGNIIKSGTLDVTMEWKDATTNGAQKTYKDASEGAIFNYNLWEPGYVEAKNIKISNVGTLALKYNFNIAANGEVSELADVIDVYFAEGEYTLSSREMTELTKVGTLSDILDGMPANMAGDLKANTADTVTIALKMQENADNKYQGLEIGSDFSIILMATQDNVEKDSFDENYDDIEVPEYDVKVIDGNSYYHYNNGVVALASVPYGNVGATFTVPNNVTVLGQGDVYADGVPVFSKSSPIETITLNEGLVEIKSRAITGVKTLSSINFPSTLKAIREQALRQTGMSEISVPANVEVIGAGAFRDMANLTTVTVKGNVAFENYAFRSCPNLTSIYLLGDDVTFAGSQFATHSDNGDATGITIYVKNATVAARVYAAQTAAYGYEVKILGEAADGSDATKVAQAKNNAQLEDAIKNGATNIVLTAGTYTFPASDLKSGVTLNCAEGTVFEGKTSLNINGATVVGATFTSENEYLVKSSTINGTFKDCVFTDSDGLRSCIAGETVVFENCVFDTDFYGVHFDSGKNDVVFKNCTFSGFNTFGAALTKLVLEDCTFKYNGKGGYNGINLWGDTEMTNCTFVFDGTAGTEWVDLCHNNKTVTFTNCVVTDGETSKGMETVVGNYGTGNTIMINGERVYIASKNAILSDAVANGAVKVLLTDDEYDLKGIQKNGLTLVGVGENVKVANTTQFAGGKAVGAITKAVNLENVTITNTVYTMENGSDATFKNVYFAAGFRQGYGKNVKFTDCTFGSNSEGYALHFQTDSASAGGLIELNGCKFEGGKVHLGGKRAYEFTNCEFAASTDFQVWSDVTVNGCTVNGEKVTAENMATLFPKLNAEKVTLK